MIIETIILLIVMAVGVAVILASRKPDEFRVERATTINAKPETIFPYLSNIEKGQSWSPWVEEDPDAEYRMEGPKEGVGATLHWDGKKSGQGTLAITDVEPPNLVRMRLEFFKPMKAVNTVEYALQSEGDKTIFTWTMFGPNNFMGKLVSLFMDCEKMCGDQFEKGLANLKAMIENPPKEQKDEAA